jgi:hypothetical protein
MLTLSMLQTSRESPVRFHKPRFMRKTQCDDTTSDNSTAEQFVDFYYKTFDKNREQLAALYVRSRSFPAPERCQQAQVLTCGCSETHQCCHSRKTSTWALHQLSPNCNPYHFKRWCTRSRLRMHSPRTNRGRSWSWSLAD